jgi:hypothetical protein
MRIPQLPDVLLFGLMGEPVYQSADRIGFCRVPEQIRLRPRNRGTTADRRTVIFDSLVSGFPHDVSVRQLPDRYRENSE